jgi:hypothetical protein
MATVVGGMFQRMRALARATPPSVPAEPPPRSVDPARTAVHQELERRRARYLREVQAMRADQAERARAAEAAERERRRQMQDAILEALARSDHGVYFPGDRIPYTRRTWLGRLVDLFRFGD